MLKCFPMCASPSVAEAFPTPEYVSKVMCPNVPSLILVEEGIQKFPLANARYD